MDSPEAELEEISSPLRKAAVVFPGQGAQGPMMGAAWRDHLSWRLVERAEAIVGVPLAAMLLDADQPPVATRHVQLCTFVVSLMAWDALKDHCGLPIVFAGHSLGQISALTALGVIGFDDAVRLVDVRGAVTEQACRRVPGGMVAMLGFEPGAAAWACSAAPGQVWPANDNAPGQMVLSGTEEGLLRTEALAHRLGARKWIRLAVDGPFHTPLMLPAARDFHAYLRTLSFGTASRPILSNADARLIVGNHDWAALLAEHLLLPVRWQTAQQKMVELGVEMLVEVGFGTTLTGIARRTVPDLPSRNLDSPEAVATFLDESGVRLSRRGRRIRDGVGEPLGEPVGSPR